MILPIVLAGGSGSRLWPVSREQFPKQFQQLHGDNTMLQATILRLDGLNCLPPLVICNEEHRFIAAEQLRQISKLDHNILLEPIGKNTAPAIALAALYALKTYGENITLLVLAADHVILDVPAFLHTVNEAVNYADDNKLVTFGIVPSKPETGYGYIKYGAPIGKNNGKNVIQFVEKPELNLAKSYLREGNYLWNSGMFCFRAERYLDELNTFAPDIYQICNQVMQNTQTDLNFIRIDKTVFECCSDNSIDYAVMEKANDVVVVPLDAGWSDVGAWSSLWDISEQDGFGNVARGDVITKDCADNYILSENGLIATIGISNLIVIQTKDAVLIVSKDKVQDVKAIVKQLKSNGRKEHLVHRQVYRPWGNFDAIDSGSRYQVKRITVSPGEKLSVQMHHHRSEHWIVVSGTAKVLIDGTESLISENQSVYIPLGAVHYLENPGKVNLELIEVQVGSYLGEDDIIRFEDRYGRI